MNKFLKSLLSDERGQQSSKRILAILGTLFLCVTMIINSSREEAMQLSNELISAIEMIVISCIGSTTIDKFSYKGDNKVAEKNTAVVEKPKDI